MTQLQSALLPAWGAARHGRERHDAPAARLGAADAHRREATAHIRAAKHERTASCTTQSNGTRDKAVATAAGDVHGEDELGAIACDYRPHGLLDRTACFFFIDRPVGVD